MKLTIATTTILYAAFLLFQVAPGGASSLKGASVKAPLTLGGKRILKSSRVKKPDYRECSVSESKDKVKVSCKATNAPESSKQKKESETKGESSGDDVEEDTNTTVSEEEANEPRGIVLAPAIEIRDKIKYTIESGKKGVEVKVDYEQEFEEMEGDGAEGETSTSFKIVFDSIVEYAKSSATMDNQTSQDLPEDQAYDWNEDEVIQTLELEDWAPFSAVESNGVVSHFFASSEDQAVAFNFSISRADQGENLTANTMKIDVHIVGFPWMRNDTFLALTSIVSSKMEVDVKHTDKASVLLPQDDVQIPFASAMDTIGFTAFGSYKWDGNAEAVESDAKEEEEAAMSNVQPEPVAIGKSASSPYNGFVPFEKYSQTIQVIASSPMEYGNETTQLIAYSFVGSAAQNASYIYWDPEAGTGYEEEDKEEYVIGANGDSLSMASSSAALTGFTPLASAVVGSLVMAGLGQMLLAFV